MRDSPNQSKSTHQGEAGVELPHVHPSGPAGVEPAVSGDAFNPFLIAYEGRGRLRCVRIEVDELGVSTFMSPSVTFPTFSIQISNVFKRDVLYL